MNARIFILFAKCAFKSGDKRSEWAAKDGKCDFLGGACIQRDNSNYYL